MTYDFTVEQAYDILQGADAQDRAEAIKFLGEQQYAPAVPILAELVEESDPGTRFLSAKALGQIGDEAEAAVPALLYALRANDMYLRMATTGALIKIGEPAVPGLIRALFDSKNAVRRAAAKALGKIGNERAINALEVAVKDTDPTVRKMCQEALTRIQAD